MRHVATFPDRIGEDAPGAGAAGGHINRPAQFSAASRPQAETMTRNGKARPHCTAPWPVFAKRTHSAPTKSRYFYVHSTEKTAFSARFEPFDEDHCKLLSINNLRATRRFPNPAPSNLVRLGQTIFLTLTMPITPSLHHSITPPPQHSTTPALHHSITPPLHHSIHHLSLTPLPRV